MAEGDIPDSPQVVVDSLVDRATTVVVNSHPAALVPVGILWWIAWLLRWIGRLG